MTACRSPLCIILLTAGLTAGLTALAGCNLAPTYRVPAAAVPADFKAAPGWATASPADGAPKGQWWRLFNDDALSALEDRVLVTNQNLVAAREAYNAARAVVRESRAALLPSISAYGSTTRTGTLSGTTPTSSTSVELSGSWDIDLWGRLANSLRQARANAQASAADLANATLSAQAALAEDYFTLRGIDAEAERLAQTIAADQRALEVIGNQLAAGTVSPADVAAIRLSLGNAETQASELGRQRAALENAIAVLVGEAPSRFRIAPRAWQASVPAVPGVLPAQILQRRPDIAAAERQVAAANAGIGIQRAALFPDISLSAALAGSATKLSGLFAAPNTAWNLGGAAGETLIDFGSRMAQVHGAEAQYRGAVASYRQTVLAAFEQVEDNLAAQNAYASEAQSLSAASAAADTAETIARNRFAAGTVDFTAVASAMGSASTARLSLIANTVNRQSAAVNLIVAIGGDWSGSVVLDPPVWSRAGRLERPSRR